MKHKKILVLGSVAVLSSAVALGVSKWSFAGSNSATTNGTINIADRTFVSYPSKGDLITMSLGNATPTWGTQDQYRVLKIDGSIAEVMAMYQISSSRKWNYDTSSYSSSATANYTYNGSLLDTYLNTTWYATLSSDAKNAIVAKTIKQNKCDYNSSSYNATTHASYATYPGTVFGTMSRNVYALDIEDIEEYFGGSSSSAGTYSTDDIKTMFGSPSTTEWLRSARGFYQGNFYYNFYVWAVYSSGYLDYYDSAFYSTYHLEFWGSDSYAVRPAFQVDLSKLEGKWSKVA